MSLDTHNAKQSFLKKCKIFLVKYVWPIWWSEALGEMEARKYSDKFMFLVNLLDPTSLSQVIFPQNMRNLSERYFARVYKTKLSFFSSKCHLFLRGSQRNTDKLYHCMYAILQVLKHCLFSRLPFYGFECSFQYLNDLMLQLFSHVPKPPSYNLRLTCHSVLLLDSSIPIAVYIWLETFKRWHY